MFLVESKKASDRGFLIREFRDLNGRPCSIQESFRATEPAIRLGVDKASQGYRRMHVSQELAHALTLLLSRFVVAGELLSGVLVS